MELNPPILVHWMDFDLLTRLGIAAILGLLLGLDRELHDKAAGLRTHGLVCFSTAAMTVSIIALYHQFDAQRTDVLRIYEATGAFLSSPSDFLSAAIRSMTFEPRSVPGSDTSSRIFLPLALLFFSISRWSAST